VFAFSQAEKPVKAELVTHYAGAEQRLPVTLNNGINYVPLPAFAWPPVSGPPSWCRTAKPLTPSPCA
jgi:hypothetical protein